MTQAKQFTVRGTIILLVLIPCLSTAQNRGGASQQERTVSPAAAEIAASGVSAVRENYTKFEYRVPMRDAIKLFTCVYIPKEVFSDAKTYPILLQRTPYSIAPYGVDQYRRSLGPSELFEREKFIFAYQDVRGRFMSEGEYVINRPHKAVKSGPEDVDESTDTYDTIEWLIRNIPGNTGKVGLYGISQPGFYATAGMIDAHPALVAVSPQAPVTDYYMGDDVYHNGAFMLAHRFSFYMSFSPREDGPEPPKPSLPFQYGTPDGYEFYLDMGSLADADRKYFKHKQPYWLLNIDHTTYDEVWKSRAIWRHLKNIKPAVMLVGGWYDTEDPQGLLRQFDFMERNTPPTVSMLVMGPWNHGGFSRGDGDRLGNVNFGSKTAQYYREKIEFPFFMYFLKGRGEGKFPKAWVFQTGVNQWRRFESWPPDTARATRLYLDAKGNLAWQQPTQSGFDEFLSDPDKPVPYIGRVTLGVLSTYMTEDQRFAATRPDVLVYRTDMLDRDVTVFGPILVDLKVSTTGTDSDFDVKIIDVYPGNMPDYNNPPQPGQQAPNASGQPGIAIGGYQQLVRGEPFRGKFRKSFETPVPFEPGKPDRISFNLPDIAHTFRQGHRIMVQIQCSWFPLTDRNPQKFMDIPKALPEDFVKATQRVYSGGQDGSNLVLRVSN
ncbi:MAG TPA: CocE/NonD family hydrolase [Acidobacteriota bacterium]|nr:CocE/NonD family hydrolase [Acidobacteriota bacterium]